MAILATNDTPSGTLQSIASANYEQDVNFISEYVESTGYYIVDSSEMPPDTLYFIDADTLMFASIGEPVDPNKLIVDSICECGPDQYRVYFSFEFCNISPFPTESSSIFIRDISPDSTEFTCFSPGPNNPDMDSIYKNGQGGCNTIFIQVHFIRILSKWLRYTILHLL